MTALLKALLSAIIEGLLEPSADGQPRKVKLSASATTVGVAAVAALWIYLKVSAVQQDVAEIKADVARCVMSTNRIESVLITRGARVAATPQPAARALWAWSFVPPAAAAEVP